MKRYQGLLSIMLLLSIEQVHAIEYPQDFNYSTYSDALLDAGFIWNRNSLFRPLESSLPDSCKDAKDSLRGFGWVKKYLDEYTSKTEGAVSGQDDKLHMFFMPGLGVGMQNGSARLYKNAAQQVFFWWQARYRNNWYARIYFRGTNEAQSLPHYTGTYEAVGRGGFKNGEVDQGVIGFKNSWLNIEYGRTREIWGTMPEENLILSGIAPAYDRLMVQFTRKNLTYRYFFGFLEAYNDSGTDILRYMVGRCLEYNNHKNLTLGISEHTVFAGPNRPLDMAYLNPIGVVLDIDLNNRSNVTTNYDNSIWGIYFDWLARSNLRISFSVAPDEFQLDKGDREAGAANALGYFGRIAWTPYHKPCGITLFIEGERLDSYFGQHSDGYANLVSRGVFLGHPIGNDADRMLLGLRCVLPIKTMLELKVGRYSWGGNSLLQNPYSTSGEYLRMPFPSGEVRRNDFMEIQVDTHPFRNLIVNMIGHIDLGNSGENSELERYTINIIYLFPFTKEY